MIGRREVVTALGLLGVLPQAAAAMRAAPGKAEPFSWDTLQQRAATLATKPYAAPAKVAAAAAIDYDKVGNIRFRADKTLAGGIRLFPLGA
jgi:glucans biosynthesis protein